jgi:hypothetical protein
MIDPVVIVVAPVGRGRFRASFGTRLLVESSTTPFLDAARVLAGERVDPSARIIMRHQGQDYDALRFTVGAAAGLDVKGDHFVKHRRRVEGVEKADQTVAHAPEPVEGSTPPSQPLSAPGGSGSTLVCPRAPHGGKEDDAR